MELNSEEISALDEIADEIIETPERAYATLTDVCEGLNEKLDDEYNRHSASRRVQSHGRFEQFQISSGGSQPKYDVFDECDPERREWGNKSYSDLTSTQQSVVDTMVERPFATQTRIAEISGAGTPTVRRVREKYAYVLLEEIADSYQYSGSYDTLNPKGQKIADALVRENLWDGIDEVAESFDVETADVRNIIQNQSDAVIDAILLSENDDSSESIEGADDTPESTEDDEELLESHKQAISAVADMPFRSQNEVADKAEVSWSIVSTVQDEYPTRILNEIAELNEFTGAYYNLTELRQEVADSLAENPWITHRAIASEVGCSEPTVSKVKSDDRRAVIDAIVLRWDDDVGEEITPPTEPNEDQDTESSDVEDVQSFVEDTLIPLAEARNDRHEIESLEQVAERLRSV